MGTLRRGLRNVYRNKIRSLLVILILTVSVAVFVTMMQASAATEAQGQNIRRSAATLVQVIPVGVAGGGGGSRTIPEDLESRIAAIPNVAQVEKYLRQQIADNTRPFAMGVINGVQPGDTLRLAAMGGFVGDPTLVAGRKFTPEDHGQPVAIVGQVFARQYGVELGSQFTLDPRLLRRQEERDADIQPMTVRAIGIYAVDVIFGDNQVFLPLDVAQSWLNKAEQVTLFTVTVNGAENVKQVEEALRSSLGDQVDILSEQASAQQTAEALGSIAANSRLAAAVASLVGALVTLFTMTLVTRERTREMAVLKAIGASNWDVAAQFIVEALALGLIAGVTGLALALGTGSTVVATVLGAAGTDLIGTRGGLLSPLTVGSALGLAIVFGLIGSLYPVRRAVQLRPAEALRYE